MECICQLRWAWCAAMIFGCPLASQAAQALISGDTLISQGLLSEQYWSGRAVADKDEALIAYVDFAKRVEFEALDQLFFIESRSIASMVTTRNSLILFSKGDSALGALQDKSIGLNGNLLSYSFNAVGMQFEGASENKEWTWRLTPKLLKITNFKSDSGSGTFSKFGDSQKLTAETSSIGIWEYGFFENGAQAVKFGNGIASDFLIRYSHENLSFQFSAENLYSRTINHSLFYNSKKYLTESKNSIIISNALPAMSGEYGQQDFVSTLPIFSKLQMEYTWPIHQIKFSAGIDTIDSTSRGWGALALSHHDLRIHIKTYSFQNMALICQVNNLWTPGLSAGLGIETDLQGAWQFNAARLSYSF